ncbi:MAG: aldolase/citrate lyase family protein [Paracoccaceae bacterium]|nr:aldolase/citrate lyase family protein [Paracoccaceae bacterium]
MTETLRARMRRGDILAGTFVKTPAHEMVEVLAMSGLDFIALDAEHAPFDRGRLDACLAVARALDFPTLVRVPAGTPDEILKALDSGATGVVVPHVDSAEKAANVARWSRFGHGGRGFAGSTRWAGFASKPMAEVLKLTEDTVVIAQIEEPEGVAAIDAIAGTEGIDGVFIGPADLSVCYGATDMNSPDLKDAMRRVGAAANAKGAAYVTFAPNTASARELSAIGVTMFFIASEHAFMLAGARQVAADLHELPEEGR